METRSPPHNFHNATSQYEKQAWKNVNRVKLVDTITKTYLYKEQLLLKHHHVYATPLYVYKYRIKRKKSLNSPHHTKKQ
jgi:oligoendopeptidase F